MEKHSRGDEDEPAPPYEESDSILPSVEKSEHRSQNAPTAQERAVEIRRQKVKLLVDGHVAPLLENAVLHGLISHTIIIVPSDAIETSIVLTTSHLVHRPKLSTAIVQLQGPNSTGAFWTQPRVIEDLEQDVRRNLGMNGQSPFIEVLPPRPADLSSPVSGRQSWMKRTFGLPGPDHDPTGSTGNWSLGWRSENTDKQRGPRADYSGQLVKVKDVAFRTETELGLLTTTTAKCLLIELESNS